MARPCCEHSAAAHLKRPGERRSGEWQTGRTGPSSLKAGLTKKSQAVPRVTMTACRVDGALQEEECNSNCGPMKRGVAAARGVASHLPSHSSRSLRLRRR